MLQVPINYLAVLAGAVSNMILGFLWYGPVFGKMWISLSGITDEKIKTAKDRSMGMLYAFAFVGALVMSYVLAHSLVFAETYFSIKGINAGLMTGFWSWLGFVAPVTLGTVLWDGKSWKLWVLNNSYYLVSLLVMGAILSLWK